MMENIEQSNVLAIKMCSKHNKPLRRGQRNCHECNRIANRKYKAQLRKDAENYRKLFVVSGLKHSTGS